MTLELLDLLGCYTVLIGSYLPTFRDSHSVPSPNVTPFMDYLTLEDVSDRMSRNVCD